MKILQLFLLTTLFLTISFGCMRADDKMPAEQAPTKINNYVALEERSSFGDLPSEWASEQNSIVLSSNPTAYTAPANEIIIEIENRGSETISFSHIDYMEKLMDGEWYRVPYVEGTDSIDIELVVKPGNTEVYKLETDFFDYDFTAGSYRIVKPFSFDNNDTDVMLAVEFEIESK